jgi:molybdate transport system substrate-binding protein
MKRYILVLAIGWGTLILFASPLASEELKVLSAVGMQEVVENVGRQFEQKTGHKLVMVFDPLGNMLKRIQNGETGDVIVLPDQGIQRLVNDAKAAATDVTQIARSTVGVAVRKGIPKPDISSPDTFRRAMLAAKAITISDPARGGIATPHILKVFERLGISDEMRAKTVYSKVTGAAGIAQVIAETDVTIALNQLQEFVPVAALEIVGSLPGELGLATPFSATVMSDAKNVAVARELIKFMLTPASATAIRAQGLQPAFP